MEAAMKYLMSFKQVVCYGRELMCWAKEKRLMLEGIDYRPCDVCKPEEYIHGISISITAYVSVTFDMFPITR